MKLTTLRSMNDHSIRAQLCLLDHGPRSHRQHVSRSDGQPNTRTTVFNYQASFSYSFNRPRRNGRMNASFPVWSRTHDLQHGRQTCWPPRHWAL